MARFKIRLESEIEHGDLISTQMAVADVLEAAARSVRDDKALIPHAIIDVPRGRLAYSIDLES